MRHLKHPAIWTAVGAVSVALLLMGIVFFAFAANGASTDYAGMALVIAAVGGILSTFLGAFATWKSSVAAVKAASADKQSAETHTVVNSRMDEFKTLFEETFRLKGKEEERVANLDRTAAAAVVATQAMAPGPLEASTTAASLLAAAEVKAQSLIAEATLAASKLLAEAHKVSITNPTADPVQVKVVAGPGVDEPLKVTTEKPKK